MPENPSTIDRLRGLLEVTRLVREGTEQSALLEAIADSIATSLGFHTVVINLYRPAWNDFEVTTVARLRRRAPGAPRRHARLGRVGPAPRRAVRAPRHLPDPARDVRLGGRRRQAVRPRLGAERRPRRLAPRRRAVRADAPLRRAHAGDPVGRRALHRHATVGRGARGARGGRRSRRPGAPELPGGGRGRTPPARASRAPPGVIAARRDAGGRGDPPGHMRRDPARARVPEGLDPAPRHRVGRVHDARDDRLDARRAGAERTALDVGARAASRPAVRDRGLLPAHIRAGDVAPPGRATACTGRS